MAENLSKNKLLLNEKKGKKKLYKSWKLYAITLGVVGISLGIGLGVGLGVNASKVPNVINLTDQEIVEAINNANYKTETIRDSSAASVNEQITGKFIQDQLTDKIAISSFKIESFKFNKITVDTNNTELSNPDLETIRTFNTKINYDYGSINNQEVNLVITVKNNNQEIVSAINDITYSLSAVLNDKATSITNQLTDGTFIQKQLSDEIANSFNFNLFKFNDVTVDNNSLTDNHLATIQILNAKINYDYDTITNQETNLNIAVKTTNQQIVDEINNTNYTVETVINSLAVNIVNQVNQTDFIKNQLTDKIGQTFNFNLFKFNKITIDGTELQDINLTTKGTINAKINYDYDTITNQETNLAINISVTNQQIVDAINSATYNLSAILNDDATSISNQLTDGTFIQKQLSDEIANSFNSNLFLFNNVIVDDHNLQNNDLTMVQTINAKINYDYDTITNQTTNLTIIVNTSDEQIVNQINDTASNYLITAVANTIDAKTVIELIILRIKDSN